MLFATLSRAPWGLLPPRPSETGVLFSPPPPHQAQRSAIAEKNPLEFVRRAGEASPYKVQDRGAVLALEHLSFVP